MISYHMHIIGMDPSRMIGETSHHHQEDEEGNTIKFLHSEHNKEENENIMNTEVTFNNKIIKSRIWKIHITVGKTLFAFLHFYSKKIKKWDFELPFQYEGIPLRDNIFSGMFLMYILLFSNLLFDFY